MSVVRVKKKSPVSLEAKRLVREAEKAHQHASFLENLHGLGVERPIEEFEFHYERKWRFDYAWPERKVAVEIDGGLFIGGAHGRGAGIVRDQDKSNDALLLGWRVLRGQPKARLNPEFAKLVATLMVRARAADGIAIRPVGQTP